MARRAEEGGQNQNFKDIELPPMLPPPGLNPFDMHVEKINLR
jgi:hypothetical protein